MKYLTTVFYRTNSGCNSKLMELEAANPEQAMQCSSDKVQRQRGVIRIDTVDCVPAPSQGKVWDEKEEHENDLQWESRQDLESWEFDVADNEPQGS